MNLKTGEIGENIATRYLVRNDFKIIKKNFKTKLGEIDIICKKGDIIHFIEVKTRRSNIYGTPREAVNFKKQERIKNVASQYLFSDQFISYNELSFDIIEVYLISSRYKLKHLKNVF